MASIKTIGFRDRGTGRYTKNYTARDNELRAEAEDYHLRQPYAVLAGLLFLPADAANDGRTARAPSSFADSESAQGSRSLDLLFMSQRFSTLAGNSR